MKKTMTTTLTICLLLSCVSTNVKAGGFWQTMEDIITLGNSAKQRAERRESERREREKREAAERLRKQKISGKIKNLETEIGFLRKQSMELKVQIRSRRADIDMWRSQANIYEVGTKEVLDFLSTPEISVLYTLSYEDYFRGIEEFPEYIDRLEELVRKNTAEKWDDAKLEALKLLLNKLEKAQQKNQEEIYQAILNPPRADEDNNERSILNIVSTMRAVRVFRVKKNDLLNRAKTKELDNRENLLPRLQTIENKIKTLEGQKNALAKTL